jgi:hypothetical protein
VNAAVDSPETESAAITALGPGTAYTGRPAAIAARTTRSPGSDTPGLPASTTSAPVSPASSRPAISAARAPSLCAWAENSGVRTAKRVSRPRVCRVSSAAIQSTARSTSSARGDRSPRFPIGVATR